jgi:hypothetical protein
MKPQAVSIPKRVFNSINKIQDVHTRQSLLFKLIAFCFESESNYDTTLTEKESVYWDILYPLIVEHNKKKKAEVKKHTFAESMYAEYPVFVEHFKQTSTYKEANGIDLRLIYNTLRLADEKYKYIDWIRVAERWVINNPTKYKNTQPEKTFSRSSKGLHL